MKKIMMIWIVMLAAASAQAAMTTRNLLANPGAEKGDMTAWATAGHVEAVKAQHETTGLVEEFSGDYFFTMGLGRQWGPSSMSQTIDLSNFSTGTLVSFEAGGRIQTELWPPMETAFDKGKLIVELFDSGDRSLGLFTLYPLEHPVLGSSESGRDYGEFSLSDSISPGTSYAVFTLEGHVVQGVHINVFYDDLFFAANVEAGVKKNVSVDGREPTDEINAELGDHIAVNLTVENPYDDAIKVEDVLGNGLKYIPNTFAVDDDDTAVPAITGNTISTMVPNGTHTITFDVQVVEVQAEQKGTVVTNKTNLYNPAGDKVLDSDSVDITLHPYKGFSKGVERCTNDPWNTVPVEADVHWLLLMEVWNVAGDKIATMADTTVHGLEVDEASTHLLDPPPSSGTVTSEKTYETKKAHLIWDIGDLDEGDAPAQLWVEIAANLSSGNDLDGPQEYVLTGKYELNSGAVVRFTDPNTGLRLSAHTTPLIVTAVEK